MTSVAVRAAVWLNASVTVIVTAKLPDTVGVPLTRPVDELMVTPAGSLPAGVTISSSTGLVSGTPTVSGSFAVTITVTDAFSQTAARTATLVIVALPAFTASVPPAGQVGVAYTAPFDVTGGTLPLTWSVTAGTLPPGLTLAPLTGAVTGTPTTVGTSSFTVTVTDANAQSASKATSVVITTGPLLIVKSANVSSAPAGSVVAYTLTVTNTGPSA